MYSFEDIRGNEQIVKNLKSMIFNNKISHSYIIDAPKGSGKKLIANCFAKAIQCVNVKSAKSLEEVKSCDNCVSCGTFDRGNHTDVIYVNPTKGKTISVDDIREQVGKNVELKPYKYKYKIFIINNADCMTPQAQNALLKTIEEPPVYGVFIFLSENYNNFLPTVLSRCVVFKLKPLRIELVLSYIKEKFGLTDDKAYVYASYAQGSIGKAVEIMESERFNQIRDMVFRFVENFYKKDFIDVFLEVSTFEEFKDDINTVLDILYLCYRDMIVLKCLFGKKDFVIQKDKKDLFQMLLENFSLESLFFGAKAIFYAKRQLSLYSNFQMTIENLLLKLKEKR